MVPRAKEEFRSGIALNSLAYAGSLLARSTEDLEAINAVGGPLHVLEFCAIPE